MKLSDFHPEDVKAAIRKRYRSFGRFERAEGLGKNSVADVLQGRPSKRTEEAILRVLAEDMRFPIGIAIASTPSSTASDAHRLSGEAA